MKEVVSVPVKPVLNSLSPEPVLNPIMKKFPEKKKPPIFTVASVVIVLFLGIGTGYVFANRSASSSSVKQAGVATTDSVSTEKEAGINDESAFPDTAQGVLAEGGISGEGTHRLDRGMGHGKDVYLSSTVINLQNFVGKKVEVRGQTISGKKAGWLMDVGKIKVIE